MRIVLALGGNALLRKGEPMTARNQRINVREAAKAIAPLSARHELIITHGNGPQVGLLAMQSVSKDEADSFPLDVLGAQTEGMIGYMIEQELGNILPFEQAFATVLTMIEVDREDPAFQKPTKPIGPYYSGKQAEKLQSERNWTFANFDNKWRRVVPSPLPRRIFEIRPIKWLLEKGTIVICAGGGGIPTIYDQEGKLIGADVVIDKDYAGALLARQLEADLYVMATSADAVYTDWGTKNSRPIGNITHTELRKLSFEEGSMGPKVAAGCWFVEKTGKPAAIGSLSNLEELVSGLNGTQIRPASGKQH